MAHENTELLRKLPKMDDLLGQPPLVEAAGQRGRAVVAQAARQVLAQLRTAVLEEGLQALPQGVAVALLVQKQLEESCRPSVCRVVNATGVVLHTNLGRAPLAASAACAAAEVARGYSNLEYDIPAGVRGSRHSHVASLLTELTGAQDAMVVNNNAAAVLLMLAAVAADREVVVSRGELVEIGGAFRVPDIMALSGAKLRETGTTNRTRAEDYRAAIGEETGALLKVHTSNYKIVGFTQALGLEEMVALGREHKLPVLYDLGGGYLRPLAGVEIPDEPCVTESIKTGVDVLCFSADKLLGGPQAGILLGKKEYIARLKSHPLARAVRVDKMTLAALEATLQLYRDEELALREVPVLHMIAAPQQQLREKAARLADQLAFMEGSLRVVEDEGQIGGGTAPGHYMPTVALAVAVPGKSTAALEAALRGWRVPIVARIAHDTLLLDLRTIEEEDFPHIAACLRALGKRREAKG